MEEVSPANVVARVIGLKLAIMKVYVEYIFFPSLFVRLYFFFSKKIQNQQPFEIPIVGKNGKER